MLKNILPSDYYLHFVQLSVAFSLLISNKNTNRNIEAANDLLRKFVHNFSILYGNEGLVYNVNNLIHIADDVKVSDHLTHSVRFRLKIISKP